MRSLTLSFCFSSTEFQRAVLSPKSPIVMSLSGLSIPNLTKAFSLASSISLSPSFIISFAKSGLLALKASLAREITNAFAVLSDSKISFPLASGTLPPASAVKIPARALGNSKN